MLGSNQAGERDNAACLAERLRAKLGMTWDQLIVRERDDDPNEIDDDLDDDDDIYYPDEDLDDDDDADNSDDVYCDDEEPVA